MAGEELMFISLKGRFVKDDISVSISTEVDNCQIHIKKTSINGNILYFTIPACTNPRLDRVNANVEVFYKQQLIRQATFLYTSSLDRK